MSFGKRLMERIRYIGHMSNITYFHKFNCMHLYLAFVCICLCISWVYSMYLIIFFVFFAAVVYQKWCGIKAYRMYHPLRARTVSIWPAMTKESNWHIDYIEPTKALHINWHLSRNNQYICQLLCFVKVEQIDIYSSGSKGMVCMQGCHYAGQCRSVVTSTQLEQPALKGILGLADRHRNARLTFLFLTTTIKCHYCSLIQQFDLNSCLIQPALNFGWWQPCMYVWYVILKSVLVSFLW